MAGTVAMDPGLWCWTLCSWLLPNNAKFTVAAASSSVVLRPATIVSRWTLQNHLSFMIPAVQEDAKSTELGHVGASSFRRFDVTKAGGH